MPFRYWAGLFMTSQVERSACCLSSCYRDWWSEKWVYAGMVKHCMAAGCSNIHKDGVSLFMFPKDFPKDPALRRQLTKQVQKTRAQWSSPTCSVASILIAIASSRTWWNRCLKRGAIPTLFDRPTTQATLSTTCCTAAETILRKKSVAKTLSYVHAGKPKKCRSAYAKKETSRVCSCSLDLFCPLPPQSWVFRVRLGL